MSNKADKNQACVCGLRKIDGRCPAKCEDFRKPRMRALSLGRKMRARERAERAPINLKVTDVRDAYERSGVDSTYAPLRAKQAARSRRGHRP